jgi:hypothetical protein
VNNPLVRRWLAPLAAVAGMTCFAPDGPADHPAHWAVEHHGSIRYGVPEPHRGYDYERDRSIRYGPWARAPFLVAPRYSREYFRLFRPGYRTVVIGPGTFYYYPVLPPGCGPVVANGQTYYLCSGVYYLPYLYQGATIYVVVPPP